MQADVIRDWNWADGYMPELRRILILNALSFVSIQIASYEQDVKKATDMLLTVSGNKSIAVRLRRANYAYRDLTLRCHRASGVETELSKIQRGSGDFYLYGWTDHFAIAEWMFVDLDQLRSSGLLNREWKVIQNIDGITSFIAIPFTVLKANHCIVSACIKGIAS